MLDTVCSIVQLSNENYVRGKVVCLHEIHRGEQCKSVTWENNVRFSADSDALRSKTDGPTNFFPVPLSVLRLFLLRHHASESCSFNQMTRVRFTQRLQVMFAVKSFSKN